ncbi:unnamed protein product [Clonostachys rosea]|uniref:Uncharacterized protein n=1 Tax=Bionectria ochroleuca TaxID=29856 RepID=A0ABY6UK99_BIOOC|nr:unnamed protein product [Clonostachys rosea]
MSSIKLRSVQDGEMPRCVINHGACISAKLSTLTYISLRMQWNDEVNDFTNLHQPAGGLEQTVNTQSSDRHPGRGTFV